MQTTEQKGALKLAGARRRPAIVSAALEWLWQHLEDVRHPHILDCGPVWQSTVEVLLCRGAKLFLTDLVSPVQKADRRLWDRSRKPPVFRIEEFLLQIPAIPPESLSAVFCWHLLDLLPRDPLPTFVDRLFSYLRPGGVLFAILREPYLAAGADATWWLENLTTLAMEREGNKPFPYPTVTNREMERLVPSGNVKTFLTRAGRREVLGIR